MSRGSKRHSHIVSMEPSEPQLKDSSPSGATSNADDDGSCSDIPEGENTSHLPLCSTLQKKHHHGSRIKSNWSERWIETFDEYDVLLSFSSVEDQERRIPKHMYPLAELTRVDGLAKSHRQYPFELYFRSGSTGDTQYLVLASSKEERARKWVAGLKWRMKQHSLHLDRAQNAVQGRARRISIERPVIEKSPSPPSSPGGVPISSGKSRRWGRRSSSGSEESSPKSRSSKKGRRSSSIVDDDPEDLFTPFGIAVANLPTSPIGVELMKVDAMGPFAAAGLRGGDVLLAVDDVACLSWSHAQKLLSQEKTSYEVTVWQSSTGRSTLADYESIGDGVEADEGALSIS